MPRRAREFRFDPGTARSTSLPEAGVDGRREPLLVGDPSQQSRQLLALMLVEILTQALAAQAGPYGIRANCIAPEAILTERNRSRIPEPQQAALADQHPIRRLGTPEDVARAALFLASEDSGWITGVVLDVAGGATMLR